MNLLFGAWVGFVLGMLGYKIITWQYWALCFPAIIFYSELRSKITK